MKWWSIFQLGVLIGEGIFQVWWLKRFFEVRRTVKRFTGIGLTMCRSSVWFRGRVYRPGLERIHVPEFLAIQSCEVAIAFHVRTQTPSRFPL